jgi:hypothetical protein
MNYLLPNHVVPLRQRANPSRVLALVLASAILGLVPALAPTGRAAPVSIWPTNPTPAVLSVSDTGDVELGLKFQSALNGYVTAIRFYKGANNTGTHVGSIWSTNGTLLASVTFSGETASGWQQQALSAPLAIASNTTYVVSYRAPVGQYSVDSGYFASAGVTNFPLRALSNAEAGGNGVYHYGEGGYPDSTYGADNYWVDLVFNTTVPPDITPPAVTAVSPVNGQTNVSVSVVLTATFSEPLLAASVTTNTFFLRDAANRVVPATVVLNADPLTVNLIPAVALQAVTNYSATLKGGANGIADLSTNRLAADYSWTFTTAPPDVTPPIVSSVSPLPGSSNVSVSPVVVVTFNETMNSSTISTNTVQLRDAANGLVPAKLAYDAVNLRATLTPLNWLSTASNYTATVSGGAGGVADLAGNVMATNYSWSFTTMPAHPYGAGPGGPILVITDPTNRLNNFYAEVLLTEGFNAYALRNLSAVTSTVLTNYDVVLLGNLPLTTAQVGMLSNWVAAGGNLIAMRPDKKLAPLLGLTDAAATLAEGYLRVDPASAAGAGIEAQTMQYHGTADCYTLSGATSLATLYANATTPAANPAVTMRTVGANGGHAAAFTYDLARSIVQTRQGNPAWAGQERDGLAPMRSDDLFYGPAAADPQPNWVDLNKVAIPQADEQQRLLANLMLGLNNARKPLPRFWYFPNNNKAVVVMTGDDHANGGTTGRFDQYIAYSPTNASVPDWQAVRGTSYIYPTTPIANAAALNYQTNGFEIALHMSTGCADYDRAALETFFVAQENQFQTLFPSLVSPTTLRAHCIAWSGYTLLPEVARNFGIRFDVDYYYWPPGWVNNQPGVFTGSAMPMRFATLEGNIIDVYQATTQMTDESGQTYPFTITSLLDRALGTNGYYGAYVANMHTDSNPNPGSDSIVTTCLNRGVPIVSSRQFLTWVDARNSSTFTNVAWANNTLSFAVVASANARGLKTLVPIPVGLTVLTVRSNGTSIASTREFIKGLSYVSFPVSSASYSVGYAADTTPPTVVSVSPAISATNVSLSAALTVQFSESMDPATINTNTFTLVDAATNPVPATVSYNPFTLSATLQPAVQFSPGRAYTAWVKGGAAGVKDVSGNALANDYVWSFTTINQVSLWAASVVPANPSFPDPNPNELGVKFQSDQPGFITGLRFYKGISNTNTHVGNLWTLGGSNLARITFANETAQGWQEQRFAAPVAIAAGTTYVASYFCANGGYAVDQGYFNTTVPATYPLRALSNSVSDGNGVFTSSSVTAFPANSANGNNYWVDVVYMATLGPDTTPPTVVSVNPLSGATNAPWATAVTAVFSEGLLPGSISTNTFTLVDASSNAVPGAVSYNPAALTATLQPASPLGFGRTYTARLKGGANGVKDLATNALAVDFVWSFTTLPQDNTPPTVTSVSPTNGPAPISLVAPVKVVFSEAMAASSINSNSFILLDSASTAVPAALAYNAATFTATLQPLAPLATNQAYTARVKGGVNGVTDLAGNPLAADYLWSFSTPGQALLSLWPNSVTPSNTSFADTSSYELGVKFQSAVSGYITGIRFYKGTNNSGQHFGNLWALDGTSLARTVFSGETAQGWQQQWFTNPVPIAAGTTYVASYFCPNGGYAVDLGYFNAQGYTNSPLRALTNNEAGGNGVYAASSFSTFPSAGGGNNYWVDVLFATGNPPPVTTNHPPTAGSFALTIPANTPANLTLQGSDPDGPVTYAILANPTNGTLSGFNTNTGTLTYTPATNYVGLDRFTYQVSDGSLYATGTVSLTVSFTNHPPTAGSFAVTLPEDTATNLTLQGNDVDGPVTYAIVTNPAHGALSAFNANTGTLTYLPATNFNGADAFTYRVSDGTLYATGTVSLTISPVDDPPTADNQSVTVLQNTATNLILTASDVDSVYNLQEVLPMAATSSPNAWILAAGANKVAAVLSDDGDSSYIRSGNSTTSQQYTIAAPQWIPQAATISSVTLRATCKRSTNPNIDYQVAAVLGANRSFGAVQRTAGNAYVQTSDVFTSKPGGGAWTLADLRQLQVLLQNLQAQDLRCSELDVAVAYVSSVNLADLTFAILVPPAHGTLSGLNPHNGAVTYAPQPSYYGPDSFTFTVASASTSTISTGRVAIAVQSLYAPFVITGVTVSNNVATVTWNSTSNTTYVLQYCDSLAGGTWTDIAPPVTATGPKTSATNALGNAPHRYYRVRVATQGAAASAPPLSLKVSNVAIVTTVAANSPPHPPSAALERASSE